MTTPEQKPEEIVTPIETPKPDPQIEELRKKLDKEEAERKRLQKELKDREVKELQAKENYKTLYENVNKELEEERQQKKELQESLITKEKFNALKSECLKLGLVDVSDIQGLDLSEIRVEISSFGNITVHGAESLAQKMKTMKPHWFTQKTQPNVNPGNQTVVTGGKLTYADVTEAENKWKKSQSDADLASYRQILMEFSKQQ